jgi:hypothetical protein
VRDPLNAGCSPFTQPEICGNLGKVAHNVEGSLVLFGDLYAKSGNAQKARAFYNLALTRFQTIGGAWRFQDVARASPRSATGSLFTRTTIPPTIHPWSARHPKPARSATSSEAAHGRPAAVTRRPSPSPSGRSSSHTWSERRCQTSG